MTIVHQSPQFMERALVTGGLFMGGPAVGLVLSQALAPGSAFASFVSFAMLPLAFVVGMHLWIGVALLKGLAWLVRRLVQWITRRHRRPEEDVRPSGAEPKVIPGSFVFVPVSAGMAGLTGVCAGLVSRAGFIPTVSAYLTVGMLYGVATWLLARAGYVDPFDLEDGSALPPGV
jgi:hypothetical protein